MKQSDCVGLKFSYILQTIPLHSELNGPVYVETQFEICISREYKSYIMQVFST